MKSLTLGLASVIALTAAAPSFAQSTEARAGAEISARVTPSEFAPSVGVLELNQAVMIEGCLEDVSWCQISFDEQTAWASAEYLYVEEDAKPVALINRPGSLSLTTVTVPDVDATQAEQNSAAALGATLGSLIAFAAGGPLGGIIAGGVIGSAVAVSTVEPSEETLVFVTANPVDTIYLNGEVAIGAGVPAEVVMFDVPAQPEFRYLNVNNQTVLVDAATGTIVRVIR
ncbi:DUF1236 domain-containing protein [Yoonia sp.]|uniref:DUF1236 domain-containing protein n=1 Tax=Yoonia sp. TaxID=2212373 RepID=UPI001A08574C|nr:DUF1236 domain-containing protein [Yoonia sp.]MBE0413223.1 DUF1236 domain-containing protein [Yoonia sp.]